jgi:hypothetical protein
LLERGKYRGWGIDEIGGGGWKRGVVLALFQLSVALFDDHDLLENVEFVKKQDLDNGNWFDKEFIGNLINTFTSVDEG